jgi:hypothetical protein
MNMSKQSMFRFSCIIATVLIAVFSSSCGRRTFPKPIVQEPPPEIKDLKADVRGTGIELSWTLPSPKEKSTVISDYRFAVMKSEVPWDKRNCLECPAPEQETIELIDPAYPEPASMKENKLMLVDAGVLPAHAYRYQIGIQNKKGRELSFSNPVIGKVMTTPQPPADFTAAKQDQGIFLQWKIPKKNILGKPLADEPQFNIERRALNGSWEVISPAPVRGNSFFDPAVAANAVYDYRVLSVLLFEGTPIWSEPSPIVHVQAPGALPPPPPNTVWAIPAKGVLEIHWTKSDGETKGYHVYRREGKEITRLTADPVQDPPYIDGSAKPNVLYFYAVSAVGVDPSHAEGLLSKWVEIRSLQFQ